MRSALTTFMAAIIGSAFLIHAGQALSAGTERVFNTTTGKWETRAAGEGKAKAIKRWANASPVPPEIVPFQTKLPAGSIVIRTAERRLYRVLGNGQAKKYGIGVGREGFEWSGKQRISRKSEWPSWTPPEEMKLRESAKGRELPDRMDGGQDNPMGARALYLGNTLYRIHGTNEPWTIGSAVSSGCIRMANEDVIDLYSHTKIGNLVLVE